MHNKKKKIRKVVLEITLTDGVHTLTLWQIIRSDKESGFV